jgi:hypothetical protein
MQIFCFVPHMLFPPMIRSVIIIHKLGKNREVWMHVHTCIGGAVLVGVLTWQQIKAASALWKFLAEPQPPLYAIAFYCSKL